jgi:hypothetical protein
MSSKVAFDKAMGPCIRFYAETFSFEKAPE